MPLSGSDFNTLFLPIKGHVVMGTQAPSVYQQVIEKTKGMMSRTQELARNIEKKLNVDKLGYDGVRATEWCLLN